MNHLKNRIAIVCSLALGFTATTAPALSIQDSTDEKRGWNWYEDPAPEPEENNPDFAVEPTIPEPTVLKKLRPEAIGKLMDDQLAYAIVSEDVNEVAEYYMLMDFARRRSRTFTALTGVAMLQNPDLNARSQYPVTNAGRKIRSRDRKADRDYRLRQESSEFALVMFSSKGCGYCTVQWGVLQAFHDRTSWAISKIDIDDHPDRAARFNVQGTPMTIMIRKNTDQWFPVSVGAESLPAIADNAYRAVRLLKGEISNQQFLTDEQDNGGFFDPQYVAAERVQNSNSNPTRR